MSEAIPPIKPIHPRFPEPRRGFSPWLIVLPIVAFALLIGGLVGRYFQLGMRGVNDPSANARMVSERTSVLGSDEQRTIELFREASPSVVFITTLEVARDRFTLDVYQIPRGTGSGFVWDETGYIVTNFHVVQEGQSIKVTLSDRSVWPARPVGGAPDYDLAVLKIDAPKERLKPVRVGRSSDLAVGQKVLAIGNPFGLDQTLTTGVISALGREIKSVTERTITGVIQTDAAINPGNSGGPLLDSDGRLIGVNAAIFSPSGAFAGIGFAIPVDTVNEVVPQLIRTGRAARPGLGIRPAEDALARRIGVRAGALLLEVNPDGAAEKAGLRGTKRLPDGEVELGDIIISVNDEPVARSADLIRLLSKRKVGDSVTLKVLRNGQTLDIQATLQGI